jgi:hypothetical protein
MHSDAQMPHCLPVLPAVLVFSNFARLLYVNLPKGRAEEGHMHNDRMGHLVACRVDSSAKAKRCDAD